MHACMTQAMWLIFFTTVTAFAKKTGDYASLSPVDLKVIALTYQLECESRADGGANLRKEPVTVLV